MRKHVLIVFMWIIVSLCMMGCSSSGGGGGGGEIDHDIWTWISGGNTVDQNGTYGTQGVAAGTNVPGGRVNSIGWIDSTENLWVFGGDGQDSAGSSGYLNDLWSYDGANWTWISGSNTVDQSGTYGTLGVAHSDNIPGARNASVSWIDSSNNLWLFGGNGYDSAGYGDKLNDLWKYDGTNWTWMSGSNVIDQSGNYGTKGTPAGTNVPGARWYSLSWTDSSGDFWLFGGQGYDSTGTYGELNDLWRFDGTDWTWIAGTNAADQNGTYGTLGVADGANVPGGRYRAIGCIDSSDDLWVFGGWGWDSAGAEQRMNDLWKFDGTNWTWISGSKTVGQSGTYGTKRTPDGSNVPGSRQSGASWIDSSDNLWLFGGYGKDSAGSTGRLNDLWTFDGTNWTWISGGNTVNQSGIYGTQGDADISNIPGSRNGIIGWKDSSDDFWVFGGQGYDAAGSLGSLNDLWRYELP